MGDRKEKGNRVVPTKAETPEGTLDALAALVRTLDFEGMGAIVVFTYPKGEVDLDETLAAPRAILADKGEE